MRLWRAGMAVGACFLLTTATGCYYARAAWEEARILAARRPITELLRDPGFGGDTARKLRLVLAARAFASESLELAAGRSFTAYSDIGRDTLVLVLSAAHTDALQPYEWRFPVVGRLPYKGFFDFADAHAEARRMATAGYDTYLRPSDAFSTLGWLPDPLLSTTLRRDSLELVNTVIHEITHNTFFLRGGGTFNESFASFVGARGTEAFYRRRGDSVAAEIAAERWADEKLLARFWRAVADSLSAAFARHPESREARLEARDSVYARARRELVGVIAPRLRTISPRYAQVVPLNNASVLARLVYGSDVDLFDDVLVCEDGSLRDAVRRIIALAGENRSRPFEAMREWVEMAGCGRGSR
jgi:predicted aminopeptidase